MNKAKQSAPIWPKVAARLTRFSLASLYLFFGVLKIPLILSRSPSTVLPIWLLAWICSLELCLGIWFLLSSSKFQFLLSLLFSLSLFSGFLLLYLGGIDLSSCGCFGSLQAKIHDHLLVLLSLIGLSAYGLVLSFRKRDIPFPGQPEAP